MSLTFGAEKAAIKYSRIERHIRSLCHALNRIPFLMTSGSCEGHPPRYEAALLLEVADEIRWMRLFPQLLSKMYQGATVSIHKRFFLDGHNSVAQDWEISFYTGNHPEWRKNMDAAFNEFIRRLEAN